MPAAGLSAYTPAGLRREGPVSAAIPNAESGMIADFAYGVYSY